MGGFSEARNAEIMYLALRNSFGMRWFVQRIGNFIQSPKVAEFEDIFKELTAEVQWSCDRRILWRHESVMLARY